MPHIFPTSPIDYDDKNSSVVREQRTSVSCSLLCFSVWLPIDYAIINIFSLYHNFHHNLRVQAAVFFFCATHAVRCVDNRLKCMLRRALDGKIERLGSDFGLP